MRLELAKQGVGDIPDDCGFLLDVDTYLGDFVITHSDRLAFFVNLHTLYHYWPALAILFWPWPPAFDAMHQITAAVR